MKKLKTFVDVPKYNKMIEALGYNPKLHCGSSFNVEGRQVYVLNYEDYLELRRKIGLSKK